MSMAETLKRRLMDQIGDSPTFVAEGSRVTGDLETAGPLVVCGAVRGDGKIGGALRMAVTAQWEGEIHTRAALIALSGSRAARRSPHPGARATARHPLRAIRKCVARAMSARAGHRKSR